MEAQAVTVPQCPNSSMASFAVRPAVDGERGRPLPAPFPEDAGILGGAEGHPDAAEADLDDLPDLDDDPGPAKGFDDMASHRINHIVLLQRPVPS